MSIAGVTAVEARPVIIATPPSSVSPHRGRAVGVLGDPAQSGLEGLPADPVTAEDGALHTGTGHPGQPVLALHRHHAGHADSDAARHGLLNRNLGDGALG